MTAEVSPFLDTPYYAASIAHNSTLHCLFVIAREWRSISDRCVAVWCRYGDSLNRMRYMLALCIKDAPDPRKHDEVVAHDRNYTHSMLALTTVCGCCEGSRAIQAHPFRCQDLKNIGVVKYCDGELHAGTCAHNSYLCQQR